MKMSASAVVTAAVPKNDTSLNGIRSFPKEAAHIPGLQFARLGCHKQGVLIFPQLHCG
jgi:hypothetical protein